MDRRKLATLLVVLFTIGLAGVAVFTAVRLYQQRQQPVAPTAPTSIPRAQEASPTPSVTCSTINFDKLPDGTAVDGTLSSGTAFPGTAITNQYSSLGATFSSNNKGVIASVGFFDDATSNPNFIVGNANSFQPIVVNFASPVSQVTMQMISVGDSEVTITAYDASGAVLETKKIQNVGLADARGRQDSLTLTASNISKIEAKITKLNSIDGFGIDDLAFCTTAVTPPTSACQLSFTLAAATGSPTATPSTTPTATPTATPALACNDSCTTNADCPSTMICNTTSGTCRNPSCTSDTDCVCTAVATPTPEPELPVAGIASPTILGIIIGLFAVVGAVALAF